MSGRYQIHTGLQDGIIQNHAKVCLPPKFKTRLLAPQNTKKKEGYILPPLSTKGTRGCYLPAPLNTKGGEATFADAKEGGSGGHENN